MNGFLFMRLTDEELWSVSDLGCNHPDTDDDLNIEEPILLFNGTKAYHKGNGWFDIYGPHHLIDEVYDRLNKDDEE